MTRRRKLLLGGAAVLLIGGGAWGLQLYRDWTRPPALTGIINVTRERSRQLVALAADEAGAIADVDVRLTRLLNLADLQIQRDWKKDARTTLASAGRTLASKEASELNSHARISGWVSIADLSRATGDVEAAIGACDHARLAMQELEDPALRCEYVMGIANQLQYLKGSAAAAEVLDAAAPWTQSIDSVARRQQAVVSFASALFNLDDFAAGQRMLRQEKDPLWRSQTLAQLASPAIANNLRAIADVREQLEPQSAAAPAYFGKQLTYDQVFRNQVRSNTRSEPVRVKDAAQDQVLP